MLMRIICLVVGFVCGSVPTGYLIARLNGVDIRTTGSGNIGTTNVLRTLGRGFAALTMVGDILKSVLPIIVMLHIFGQDTSVRYVVTMYTGFGAVIGHDFSPFMGFKGGKGIATSGGMILVCDPRLFVVQFLVILAATLIKGYVSLGSLIASAVYIAYHLAVVLGALTPGWSFYPQTFDPAYGPEIMVLSLIIAGVAVYRHKANIVRLLNGTENKVSLRGRKKSA